ncbi:stabilin-2 isoform X1 [Labeo rohita]|uniref:Stabilin-2 isoform X1 n=1 Tax=Labeo rohita TaxID=84645 RepID=A0A498MV99_LABRO|nr:stabilin-2 isoform X1 [Labeo rohita]
MCFTRSRVLGRSGRLLVDRDLGWNGRLLVDRVLGRDEGCLLMWLKDAPKILRYHIVACHFQIQKEQDKTPHNLSDVTFYKLFEDTDMLKLVMDPIHQPVTLFLPTDAVMATLAQEQKDFLYAMHNHDKLLPSEPIHASFLKCQQGSDLSVACMGEDRISATVQNMGLEMRVLKLMFLFAIRLAMRKASACVNPSMKETLSPAQNRGCVLPEVLGSSGHLLVDRVLGRSGRLLVDRVLGRSGRLLVDRVLGRDEGRLLIISVFGPHDFWDVWTDIRCSYGHLLMDKRGMCLDHTEFLGRVDGRNGHLLLDR